MHTHRRHTRALTTLITLTAIVACADAAGINNAGGDSPGQALSPARPDSGRQNPDSGKPRPDTGGTRPDTGGPRPDTGDTRPDTGGARPDTGQWAGPDTTVNDAFIRGRVVAVDSVSRPAKIGPLGGVTVTALRRVVTRGSAGDSGAVSYVAVATSRADASGDFAFTDLQGGFYRLRAVPPSGSGYTIGETQTVAWSIRALVLSAPPLIYLYKLR